HHLIRNIFRIFLYVRNEKRDRIGGIPLPKERNQLGREVDCIAATVTCRKRAHSRKRFFRPIEKRAQESVVQTEVPAGSGVQYLGRTDLIQLVGIGVQRQLLLWLDDDVDINGHV